MAPSAAESCFYAWLLCPRRRAACHGSVGEGAIPVQPNNLVAHAQAQTDPIPIRPTHFLLSKETMAPPLSSPLKPLL